MKTDAQVEADLDKLSAKRGRTPEGNVKDDVKFVLGIYGAWYWMAVKMIFGKSGLPDFIGCYRGLFFAVETKAKNGKPTALQTIVLTAIAKAGGKTFITNEHNLAELEAWLKSNQHKQ